MFICCPAGSTGHFTSASHAIVRRAYQHKTKATPGFTSRSDVVRLVWFEVHDDPTSAITREKQIKKWRRDWKIALIEERNPDWADLYENLAS